MAIKDYEILNNLIKSLGEFETWKERALWEAIKNLIEDKKKVEKKNRIMKDYLHEIANSDGKSTDAQMLIDIAKDALKEILEKIKER